MTERPFHSGDEPSQAELLLGRVLDGVASDADRARFDELIAAVPELRDELTGLRRADDLLARIVAREVDRLSATDLDDLIGGAGVEAPTVEVAAGWGRRVRFSAVAAAAGWAATILVALAWWGTAARNAQDAPRGAELVDRDPPVLDPDRNMEIYLSAPFVAGEWAPMVVGVEKLPDGRSRVRYVRRIEEIAIVDGDVPQDDQGRLTVSPASLRDD